MIKIKNSAEFERLLKALSNDIVDAHIHYRLYKDIDNALSKHPLVAQQSNIFWTYTLQAHLNSSLYALFRAYDQNKSALHLRSLLLTIKANLYLFDETGFRERLKDNPYVASLAQDSKKPDARMLNDNIDACSQSDPLVKNLIRYRGNHLAHKNANSLITSQEINDNNELMFEDFNLLLERAKTILNKYSYLFSASF